MSNPWTPGPWEARCRHVDYAGGVWPENEFLQWEVAGPRVPDGRGEFYQADARLIAAAPEMADALGLLEDAASCLIATFGRISENYPEHGAIHTHEDHTEAYLIEQVEAARAILSRIRGDAP